MQVIVFCTTAMVTRLVADLLSELKLNVREIHSRKPQTYRTRVSKEFRESKGLILVSSDVSARGVDYPNVTFVIQVVILLYNSILLDAPSCLGTSISQFCTVPWSLVVLIKIQWSWIMLVQFPLTHLCKLSACRYSPSCVVLVFVYVLSLYARLFCLWFSNLLNLLILLSRVLSSFAPCTLS